MRWEPDVSRGDWLAARLGEPGRSMHGVVPRGFEAYARVFHSVEAEGADRRPATWREVSETTGATWHPLMQWQAISRGVNRYSDPQGGNPGAALVAALAATLAPHTSAPGDVVAGVWEGWGGLFDDQSRSVSILVSIDGGDERNGAAPVTLPELRPPLDPAIASGPRLRLPWRDHVLFATTLEELADAEWPERAAWVRDLYRPDAPSLIWPEDHSWVVVSEIDWDSTIVAGSRAAVDAVLACDGVEALEIPEDADLTSLGDTING